MKNYQSINPPKVNDGLAVEDVAPLLATTNGNSGVCNVDAHDHDHDNRHRDHRHHDNRHHDNRHRHRQPPEEESDHLVPPYDSPLRPSNIVVGTFNLIATIIGGGVLSLPLVFRRCGIAFTTLAMLFSSFLTYASLTMLAHCSRRGGGSSYGEVVRSAFGERAEEGVSWLLFVFLMFVIVGYMILIRDIWTPLTSALLAGGGGEEEEEEEEMMMMDGDRVLLGIVVVLLPFLFQRSLHSLRYNCYVGSASIFVLCVALCRGGLQRLTTTTTTFNNDDKDDNDVDAAVGESLSAIQGGGGGRSRSFSSDVEFYKVPSIDDVLFSFPIVTLAFLCHFNIIAIQNALAAPTRRRMRNLTRYAMAACFLLMYAFGLGGYLYAGSGTEGNILLNVPMTARPRPLFGEEEEEDDDDATEHYLFLLGRIGCGTMIMFAMPMMALPCREALLEVVDVWFHSSHHHHHHRRHHHHDGDDNESEEAALASEHRRTKTTTTTSSEEEEEEEEGSFWRVLHRLNATETARDARVTTEDEVTEIEVEATTTTMGMEVGDDYRNDNDVIIVPRSPSVSVSVLIRTTPIQGDYVFRNTLLHYGSTLMIVGTCYLGAVSVSGVETVWSFIGSSMAFFIAFILPCGCFVAIEGAVPTRAMGGDREEAWIRVAWAILSFSVVGAVVCTVNNTLGFGH